MTLLHLVSHYQKWDIQLDGLCSNRTQWTHFKLKSWVYGRHGKDGPSWMIIKAPSLFFFKQMLFLRLKKMNFPILIDQDSFFWILCRKWNVQMKVCSMRIGNIAHNESHVYARCVKQSINATGNRNYEQNCEPSATRWTLWISLHDTSYNNVNPGQLNEIHLCQPWLLYNQFAYKSKRIWGTWNPLLQVTTTI